jgi:hypothetical protein
MISGKLSDGTLWPIPGEEMSNHAWRLRHGDSRDYTSAGIVDAYEQLLVLPVRDRNKKISMIRAEMKARRR